MTIKEFKAKNCLSYIEANRILQQLINEHFDNECKRCESKFLKDISDVEKENDKLRIALDKACKILDECVIESDWKEQLLNDSN